MATANEQVAQTNFTMLIKRRQRRLKPGDWVRVWTTAGSWQVLTIYSKHKAGWFNVLRLNDTVPVYSIKLLDGGRWYCINHPQDKDEGLEEAMTDFKASEPHMDLSIPILEGEVEVIHTDQDPEILGTQSKPSIIGKEDSSMANLPYLPRPMDTDNNFDMMLPQDSDEHQCLEAYLSLPKNDSVNIFEFHRSIEERYPSIVDLSQIKTLTRGLVNNLGALALLRLRNPRPRNLIKGIDENEANILLQIEEAFSKIETQNKEHEEEVARLETDLARTIQIYQEQKHQVIKAAEPVTPQPGKNLPESAPQHNIIPSSTPLAPPAPTFAQEINTSTNPPGQVVTITDIAPSTILKPTKGQVQRKRLELNSDDIDALYDYNSSNKSLTSSLASSSKSEAGEWGDSIRTLGPTHIKEAGARNTNPFTIYKDHPSQGSHITDGATQEAPTPFDHQVRREEYKRNVDEVVRNVMTNREALKTKLQDAQRAARDYQEENEKLLRSNQNYDTAIRNVEELNRNFVVENMTLANSKKQADEEIKRLTNAVKELQEKLNMEPQHRENNDELLVSQNAKIQSLEMKCQQLTNQRNEAEQFALDCQASEEKQLRERDQNHHKLSELLEQKIRDLQLDQSRTKELMERREKELVDRMNSQIAALQGKLEASTRSRMVLSTSSQLGGRKNTEPDEGRPLSSRISGLGNTKMAGGETLADYSRNRQPSPTPGMRSQNHTLLFSRPSRVAKQRAMATLEEEVDQEILHNEGRDTSYDHQEGSRELIDPVIFKSNRERQGQTQDNSHLLSATLRSYLEEIEELNTDLHELIEHGINVLQERQDGAIKELKRTISTEYSKLKDQSRRTRNSFKLEARRRLTDDVAEEVIRNPIVNDNIQLAQKASEIIRDVDKYIKERGLNLLQTSTAKETKIVWPTFTGQSLPLVGDFLAELESLMVRAGIPVSDRGAVLSQHVGGQAKNILKDATQERNPSFEHLAGILRNHFGQPGTQVDLLQRLHQKYGSIPPTNDMSQSMMDLYNVVKHHITLLKAAGNLHQQYTAGHINENPLTGSYLNSVEKFLPREDRKRLTSIPGYHAMETQERFREIQQAFKNTQHFASTEIAKHGYEPESIEPKKKPRQPLFVAATPPTVPPVSNPAPANPPPIFSASPPTVPLPLPPATTRNNNVQCFRCKGIGHYANSCPTRSMNPSCVRCSSQHPPGPCPPRQGNGPRRGPPLTRNQATGSVTTTLNNDVINLQSCEQNSGYFFGDTTCLLCQKDAQQCNTIATPSRHIFTPSGRLERLLCPTMTRLENMEERVAKLDLWRICRACLNSSIDNAPSHTGTHCQALNRPNTQHLKCSQSGCPIRYTLCLEHKNQNQEKLNVYMSHTHQQSKINIGMTVATGKGEHRTKTELAQQIAVRELLNRHTALKQGQSVSLIAACNGKITSKDNELQQFISTQENIPVLNVKANFQTAGLFEEVKALINDIPEPFLPVSETPHHFQLFLMQGKTPEKPIVVCFDTASAYTILTDDTIKEKLQGRKVHLPGSSWVSGIGGERETRNLYCSFPLNPATSDGYASKIMSCLSVDSIVEIETIDIAGVEEFLKENYAEQLPSDFMLFNFRELGTKIQIDCLVGVDDLKIHPKLILTTTEGLNVYQVPVQADDRASQYCIGGNIPLLPTHSGSSTTISYAACKTREDRVEDFLTNNLITSNLDDIHFLGEDVQEEIHEIREMIIGEGNSLSTHNDVSLISLSTKDNEELDQSKRIRANLMVTSPLPLACMKEILQLQSEMVYDHPSLKEFSVPQNDLCVTHLALAAEEPQDHFFEQALTEMFKRACEAAEDKKQMVPISMAIGNRTMLNGNICVEVSGKHLKIIKESAQQECRTRGFWFDPEQPIHIVIFRKEKNGHRGPNVRLTYPARAYTRGQEHNLGYVDLCRTNRSNEDRYFNVLHRADIRSDFEPISHEEIKYESPIQITESHSYLPKNMKGLCDYHWTLVSAVLPSMSDWRNMGSVTSIINDIFPPLGVSPTKPTIPIKLYDILVSLKPKDKTPQRQWALPSLATVGSQKFHDAQFKAMFEEDHTAFRCLSCRLCQSCSVPGQGGSGHLSLREETENLLIKNSVSIDLSQNKIVAKHVLPSNYLDLLGDNKSHCERRLRNQLRKLAQRSQKERDQVKASVNKLRTRDFLSSPDELSPLESRIVEENQSKYYIPTTIVFKESSLSTPSRVCMDGSAKTDTGYSLNDLLIRGSLSLDIGSLIQNWKALPIAASGDLASYYCRFSLSPEHWPIQKFLWNDELDPDGELKVYYIKTIIYGLKSSGLVCHFGINKLIDIFDHLKALTLYVDDAVASFYDIDQAKTEVEKIAATLARFNLPFKGSGMAVTGLTPPKEIVDEEGAVGISCAHWSPIDDTFTCSIPPFFLGHADRGSLAGVDICKEESPEGIVQWLPATFTLKQLLSKVATYFDGQLGLMTSLTGPLRFLVRKVLVLSKHSGNKPDWNFPVPMQDRITFAKQICEIKKLGKFKYRRFPITTSKIIPNKKGILICFSDSGDLQSVVIYLGLEQEDGKWCFNLITARTYLVINDLTLPKSELQAAAHGANATQSVIDHFRGKLDITAYLFIDSECSIHWIANANSLLQVFHRNRVAAIISVFGQHVFHVQSDFNLADDISRLGTTAETISPTSRFYLGPNWLTEGFDAAKMAKIIVPIEDIAMSNMTPQMLETFRSGVILSQYCDLNTMKLKRQVDKKQEDEQAKMTTHCRGASNDKNLQVSPNMPQVGSPALHEIPPLKTDNEDLIIDNITSTPTTCVECKVDIPAEQHGIFYSSCIASKDQHAYCHIAPKISTLPIVQTEQRNWEQFEPDLEEEIPIPTRQIGSHPKHATFMASRGTNNLTATNRLINQLVTTRSRARLQDGQQHYADGVYSVTTKDPKGETESLQPNELTTHPPVNSSSCDKSPPSEQPTREYSEYPENMGSKPWTARTKQIAKETQYLISPLGKSLPTVVRAGAAALRFIGCIVDRMASKSKKRTWHNIKARLSAPSDQTRITSMIISPPPRVEDELEYEHVIIQPEQNDASCLANTYRRNSQQEAATSEIPVSKDDNLLKPTKRLIKSKALRYPGMAFTQETFKMYEKYRSKRTIDVKASKVLLERITMARMLANSLLKDHIRPAARAIGHLIHQHLTNLDQVAGTSKHIRALMTKMKQEGATYSRFMGFRGDKNPWDEDPPQPKQMPGAYRPINFFQIMKNSYTLGCRYTHMCIKQLVLSEQTTMRKLWTEAKLNRHCTEINGVLMSNTRWRPSVNHLSNFLTKDPDAMNMSNYFTHERCPVLDKNSPLYISIAQHVHINVNLPKRPTHTLSQKHRGICQDLQQSLAFAYAPGGIATFKRIQNSCFTCIFRIKKFVQTREGDIHHARLIFIKPFFSSHIDLLGPLFIKLHDTAATRRSDNERKIWLLCTVCAFTRAVWVEVMQGTGTADVSDALTRTMSYTGSIGHLITDRLASQLRVAREGVFFEQIQHQMFRRLGWYCTVIPVSRHNHNAMVENRIKAMRSMLCLENNHTGMKLLEFITLTRVATNLINAIPLGYTIKGAGNNEDLRIISPSSFLFPLMALHRPILSPVIVDEPTKYFEVIQTAYQGLLQRFSDSIIPYVMQKHHKFQEHMNSEALAPDHIVLFKKKPGSWTPGWNLGRVVNIQPSKDGTTHQVTLEYINRGGSDGNNENEKGTYDTEEIAGYENIRGRVDKKTHRIHTTRQTDELIRLHPILPQENDINNALHQILQDLRSDGSYQVGENMPVTLN